MKRKICVITGTRAEYGLLQLLIQGLKDDPQTLLQLVVTGMHLSPEFGSSYRNIENDGFFIDRKVEMLLSSDSDVGIGKSFGLGVIGFVEAISELSPHLILVLGDRFEILAAVSAALFLKVPVVHLHGGEVTEGALDESMRHAITKMSQVHCVATDEYRKRVIQLGEIPERVHCVGGLGVDMIKHTYLMDRYDLERDLDFKFRTKNLLVTLHPETLATMPPEKQMLELLSALGDLSDTGIIFTQPNADAGSREIISMVKNFVATHPNAREYSSLGQRRYLSCMAFCDAIVGNSSSGLLEAPTFKKGTINIGDRQLGRQQASSVINCRAERNEIKSALQKLYSLEFQACLLNVINPYGDGGATVRIINIIKSLSLDEITKKPFYDLS
jgi:GDP/UDP-N,N'-diacetylbacillosamine 2-epimerase (hydrolysing)